LAQTILSLVALLVLVQIRLAEVHGVGMGIFLRWVRLPGHALIPFSLGHLDLEAVRLAEAVHLVEEEHLDAMVIQTTTSLCRLEL
jgi:hypothetical protein